MSRISLVLVLVLVLAACGPTGRGATSAMPRADDAGAAEEATADTTEGETETETETETATTTVPAGTPSPCPVNMVLVASGDTRFCVDKYEASLVETDADGNEKRFPHWLPVDGHAVRAVSEPDVFPQGFISEVQAEDACAASGKRLCSHTEWKTACMGPTKTTFPYGDSRQPGVCHDTGKSAVGAVFGARAWTDPVATAPREAGKSSKSGTADSKSTAQKGSAKGSSKGNRQAHVTTKGRAAETTRTRATRGTAKPSPATPSKRNSDKAIAGNSSGKSTRSTKRAPAAAKASTRPASVEPSVWTQLNDPRLGQVEGALSKTGSHEACVNGYGAVDMVGNLHEWVKTDPSVPHGTFAGGYYLDTALNGDGCQYRTTAHAHDYHDYSTGFRCCAEAQAAGGAPSQTN